MFWVGGVRNVLPPFNLSSTTRTLFETSSSSTHFEKSFYTQRGLVGAFRMMSDELCFGRTDVFARAAGAFQLIIDNLNFVNAAVDH